MTEASEGTSNQEEVNILWAFCEKQLLGSCQLFDGAKPHIVSPIFEVLSIIVNNFKPDDFRKRLTHSFLQ